MSKRNRSNKRELTLDDMPIVKLKKGVKVHKFSLSDRLSDRNFVALAFFDALSDNDIDAALDIIDGYLMATGKIDIARESGIPRSTIYHALSEGANPTLKTIARILQAAA